MFIDNNLIIKNLCMILMVSSFIADVVLNAFVKYFTIASVLGSGRHDSAHHTMQAPVGEDRGALLWAVMEGRRSRATGRHGRMAGSGVPKFVPHRLGAGHWLQEVNVPIGSVTRGPGAPCWLTDPFVGRRGAARRRPWTPSPRRPTRADENGAKMMWKERPAGLCAGKMKKALSWKSFSALIYGFHCQGCVLLTFMALWIMSLREKKVLYFLCYKSKYFRDLCKVAYINSSMEKKKTLIAV